MKNSKEVIRNVVQEIEASKKISETPLGQTKKSPDASLADTINQVFALFRLNYHNQYYAAFQDEEQLKQIKLLWRDALSDYPVELILLGAKKAIECNEYLPTLHQMLVNCQDCIGYIGLPKAYDAFHEACQASSPKAEQHWSHPAVYFAGRDTGWFFLSTHKERETWPVYRENFNIYLRKVFLGEKLAIPRNKKKKHLQPQTLTSEEQKNEIRKLREELGI